MRVRAGRPMLHALLAAALFPGVRAAHAAETITVVRTPGQSVTVVAEPATAARIPALAQALAPHAARVGRWAGDRPPATIFLVADLRRVPDPPGPAGELPGAQVDLDRAALHLWAGLVVPGAPASPELTRVLSTFLVHTALRQLVGQRPRSVPIWLVLGLLDDASLAPPTPVDPRALRDAPFLELLHPAFNEPFVELLEVHPQIGTAVARAVVDDLFARAAPTRLGALLRGLREDDFDDAFRGIYGLTLEAYQEELKLGLGPRRRL